MNIDIKFINENTVEINASLQWLPRRPPRHLKEVRMATDVVNEFTKKHPSYIVEDVKGPHRIFNCKNEDQSKGKWTLTVSKKVRQKRSLNQTTKKGA